MDKAKRFRFDHQTIATTKPRKGRGPVLLAQAGPHSLSKRVQRSAVVIATDILVARRSSSGQAQRLRRLSDRANLIRRVVIIDLHLLQRSDQRIMQLIGKDGFFRDFAQGNDRILVAIAIQRKFGAARNFAGALSSKKDQVKTIGNLVDAIFDGDAGQTGPPEYNEWKSVNRAASRLGTESQ